MKRWLRFSRGRARTSRAPGHDDTLRHQQQPLLRVFKSTPLDQITSVNVESYKTARAGEKGKRTGRKLRPATVNREPACLRAMFNHVLKGDLLLRNPVSRVKFLAEDNLQDRTLKYAEQRSYLAAATETLQHVAGLILETGMRPEEVYTLRAAAVDLDGGFLRVLKGKTPAAKRRIELTAESRRIIEARLAGEVQRLEDGRKNGGTPAAGAGYLFPQESDPGRPIPKINNAHDRAVRDSKLTPFRL